MSSFYFLACELCIIIVYLLRRLSTDKTWLLGDGLGDSYLLNLFSFCLLKPRAEELNICFLKLCFSFKSFFPCFVWCSSTAKSCEQTAWSTRSSSLLSLRFSNRLSKLRRFSFSSWLYESFFTWALDISILLSKLTPELYSSSSD